MPNEHNDTPDWEEAPEEEVPPSLHHKWEDDQKKGLRAGVCPSCSFPFTEEDLSCRHCGRPTQIQSGLISSLSHWLLKTPWGIVTFLIILFALMAVLIQI